MAKSAHRPRYTLDEYLKLEEISNVRHEYLDGEIYAMAGGTPEHGRIAANIIALLGSHESRTRCAVFTSDVRVRVAASGLDTYPDISVVCGHLERDSLDAQAIANPVVIFEVTSPSSDAYDRGEKLRHYQQIPSLREIVIVSHSERRVDVWRRGDEGEWERAEIGPSGVAHLAAIDCDLPVDDIYRDPLDRPHSPL
ncbi:MAG TPA: Uma2 family endonuclease [Thermoanaerobaculia bacterium]|nr:Uma2 family endonuclease [Thermoanaerobaculia bacterium]